MRGERKSLPSGVINVKLYISLQLHPVVAENDNRVLIKYTKNSGCRQNGWLNLYFMHEETEFKLSLSPAVASRILRYKGLGPFARVVAGSAILSAPISILPATHLENPT